MGNEDAICQITFTGWQIVRVSQQHFKDTLNHLHHIGFTFTQIRIIDRFKLCNQLFHLLRQGPFCIAMLSTNELLRHRRQHGIIQYHQMHIQERWHFRRRISRDLTTQSLHFLTHCTHRIIKPCNFFIDSLRRQYVMRHFDVTMRSHPCHTNRDTRRYTYAM